MTLRARIGIVGIVVCGTLVLVALAPWLNPCIGPLRFVDCIEWEESTVSNDLSLWLFCPLEICDYFPSASTRALKLLVAAMVLCAVGMLAGRVASRNKVRLG